MKAIIIKGNPEFVKDNDLADKFYGDLKRLLESLGYEVAFDAGDPYTEPPTADLWIGHSRGADRLRFAPSGTLVLGIGVPDSLENNFKIINHPKDKFGRDLYHFLLTDRMKEEIKKIALRL